MKRITVGELKRTLSNLPDDTIVCCYSDSEGNSKSTALDVFTEVVGEKMPFKYGDKVYEFTGGEDVEGIDLTTDKGKTLLYIQPSL